MHVYKCTYKQAFDAETVRDTPTRLSMINPKQYWRIVSWARGNNFEWNLNKTSDHNATVLLFP